MGEEQAEKVSHPEEVREVLISTQQNDSSHDFHVVNPLQLKLELAKSK